MRADYAPKILVALALVLTAVSCEKKQSKYVAPEQSARDLPDGLAAGDLRVSMPVGAISSFPVRSGDAQKHITHVAYDVEVTGANGCNDYSLARVLPYKGPGFIEVDMADNCIAEIYFAMGNVSSGQNRSARKIDRTNFVPIYETVKGFEVDKRDFSGAKSLELEINFERTAAGGANGFTKTVVQVTGEEIDESGTQGGDPGSQTNLVNYFDDVKQILDEKCVSCHSPRGKRSSSDLSTFKKAKLFGDSSIAYVNNGLMPKQGSTQLSKDEIRLLNEWKDGGFAETSSDRSDQRDEADGGNSTDPNDSADVRDDGVVEFRIASGTGSGPWNTQQTSIKLKVGQTLRIYNDDNSAHQLHTNGAPTRHGDLIQPGQSKDLQVTRPFSQGSLYDHIYQNTRSGTVYIEAVQ